MRKFYLAAAAGLFLAAALLAVAAVAQYGAPQAAQAPTQPQPFTAKFFGPWNEAVAKTHVPMVKTETAGMGMKVSVQIDNHPMDPQKPHWIERIWVEDMKGNLLAEKTFKPTDPSPPTADFELDRMYEKISVFEHCNIHGIWLNEVTVPTK
jgi:desulfoferrodoxin-like iron-binding protein